MLIYTGEYTDEVLSRVRIKEVSEAVLGFSEMATIRIGNLMDVPRHARIQSLKREKAAKEREVKATGRRKEEEAAAAANDEEEEDYSAEDYEEESVADLA